MNLHIRSRAKNIALVAAGILAGSAGVAFATGQVIGAGGVIQGCYRVADDDRKGELRVVSDAAACRANELPISWSVQGPKGDQGDQGPQGIQGPPGEKGDQGPQGLQGEPGAKGDPGQRGIQGERGPQGSQGERGPQGAPGEKGDTGATGAAGATGPAGVSAYEVVVQRVHVHVLTYEQVWAWCPPGKRPLGGGAWSDVLDVKKEYAVDGARNPTGGTAFNPADLKGWTATAYNGDPFTGYDLFVFAICANV
jgi:hypothetical protein